MSFRDATSYLDALGIDAMKKMAPSLHRIEAICEALNNPERSVPAIHITGTNGKTSTARIASSLLEAVGLNVGTYTSPHLQTVRERICHNADFISEDAFGDLFDHLLPYVRAVEGRLGETLTYFEILTAMYFLWASEAPVDVSVVEVGLGGTWDATNVVKAPVAVITNVARDHTQLLGEDPLTIATEKAGIVKDGAAVLTGELNPGVLELIRSSAEMAGGDLAVVGREFEVVENRVALGGRYLSIRTTNRTYEGLFLPLHGAHQGLNAALALQAVISLIPTRRLEDEIVQQGFAATSIPGRAETVRVGSDAEPVVVLDVAHNPDGMSALMATLVETFAFERVLFVAGVLSDKDHEGMMREMTRLPCSLYLCEARSGRARPKGDLAVTATSLGLDHRTLASVEGAVSAAIGSATSGDLVCVTGSHYVVGEARSFLVS